MIHISIFSLCVISILTQAYPVHEALSVIGGTEAVAHSLPYQVALITDSENFCGGVLISTKHILTAAHCVIDTSTTEVILGAHDIECYEDTQRIFYNPQIIIHSNFDGIRLTNDIALLKLNEQVEIKAAIKPIKYLADEHSGNFVGSNGLLSGWGSTSYSSSYVEPVLRQVYLDIIPNSKCAAYYSSAFFEITSESKVCTSGYDKLIGAVGASYGDSGGPLVVQNTLVGLVSFGFLYENSPTVYTRVSYFREWIRKYSGV